MAGGDPAPPPQPMGLGTHLRAGRAAGGAGARPGMLSPLPVPICPTSIPCNPCPLLPRGPYPGPRRVVAALGRGKLAASTGTVLPACPCPCPAADCCADLPAGRSGEEVQGRGGLSRGQLRHRLCCHGGESVPGQDSPADLGKACWWGGRFVLQIAQDVQAALLPPPCATSSLSCLSFPMREAALLLLTGLSSHVRR